MSFRLYLQEPFQFRHENRQFEQVIGALREQYSQSSKALYCLANVPFTDQSTGKRRQFDLLIIEPQSISVVEFKHMKGSVRGDLFENRGNAPLKIAYDDGQEGTVRVEQLESQKDYLLRLFSFDLRERFKLGRDAKFDVDVYLVFLDGTDLSGLRMDPKKVGRWLIPTTVGDFLHQYETRTRRRLFRLHSRNIKDIAEKHFGLSQVDPATYWIRLKSVRRLLSDLVADLERGYDAAGTEEQLRDLARGAIEQSALDAAVEYAAKPSSPLSQLDASKLSDFVEAAKQVGTMKDAGGVVERLFAQRAAEFIAYMARSLVEDFLEIRANPDTEVAATGERARALAESYQQFLEAYRHIKLRLQATDLPDTGDASSLAEVERGSAVLRALAFDWRALDASQGVSRRSITNAPRDSVDSDRQATE